VLRWIEKGNLTAFRLPGGQNRIHRDDFFAFADRHSIPIRRSG
jgi:excisionase family DNA binding protein